MKKVSDTRAKTPSGPTRTEEILDDINVLVGQISKAEDLCVSNLKTISSALDAKLLKTIVYNTEALVKFSSTQSASLMGIAGYLLGYKGINPKTNAASLLGKIKNNEPLFLGPREGSKFYGDLLEEILSKYTTTTGSDSANATLNIVLSSIDGGNFDSLIELINELQKTGNVENIEVLTIIQSLIQQLDDLGKTELDNELISMKMDDVQLAIFNIGETFNELSNLERRIKGVDIKAINTGFDTLSKFQFTGNLKNIVKSVKELPDLLDAITSINFKGINGTRAKQLDILVSIFDQLYTVLNYIGFLSSNNYEDALDVFSDDILPYFESGKKKGLVERIADIPFNKFNKTTLKQLTTLEFTILTFGDIFKAIKEMLPIMSIVEGSKKNIIKGIDVLYDIIDIINKKTSAKNIKASVDNIHPYAEFMKDLATIFKYVVLTGALSIPALVGSLLLSATLKTIFTALDGALSSIQKFVSNKDTKTSIESMKTVIVSISLLMIFASIMGGIVMKHWIGILAFLGMFTVFTLAVLGAITFVGGLVNKLGAKGGVEALSKLTDIIVACTFCMLAGASFMMIPNITAHILSFTILLAVFVASLLSTFLGISFIGGKKMKAQIDEFAKLVAICAGALMIGALFMMIPNIFVHALAFAGLLVLFTGTILAAFLWISKIGGRKIKAQMGEFAKLIAICAGVLIVGALFMMIPAYRENAWKFALMLGVFVTAMAGVMILLAKTSKNIAIGTLCMIALVGVTFLFGFALQNIANVYKIFKDPGEAFICLGWVAGVLVTFAGVIFGLGALMGTGIGAGLFVAGVAALGAIIAAVWTLGEALKAISEGITSIRALSKDDDQINIDNITKLIGNIKDIAEKFDVLDKVSLKNIKRSSKIIKMISTSISSISEVVKDTASLKIPIYDDNGSITGYRQLKPEDFALVTDNVGTIVTSLADALSKAYNNNPKLFKDNKTIKVVLKALKGVSDVINKFTDVIVKFAKSEFPEYDVNGNPTGKTVHINDTIIGQMKGSIETLITAVLGSISEIYADPKTQKLFSGRNLKNATNAIKDVSAIIGGLGKDIVDLAGLYIKDENGKVVRMDSTHFEKAKQNLKDIITCILGGVDDLSKDNDFKKFTESGGLFGSNSWDVPTNIKKNLDKVKPLITSAIENINSINEAVKLLTPTEGKNNGGKTWTDLLSIIFDPLKSFEIEDENTAKKKKESIKKSLENARSIINEINRLDESKADKFIKLSQELRDLSVNVGDMSGFMEALNGKINDTLNKVSESLIESTTALRKSDEAHEKRNEVIKQNTAELKKVLETPMKVNVITTTAGSTETSFADANIGGGEATNVVNFRTPEISTNAPGNTSSQPRTSIDNSTLTSIAGNTTDILMILRELLEKQ